jgi:hypothetical protein
MRSRKTHKIIGLILVLPMLGWTLTGLIFFIKPGYSGAYEQLKLKTYPLEESIVVSSSMKWEEAKLIKTILGHHLLVKAAGKVKHLDPVSLLPKEIPSSMQYESLLVDAFSKNKERYGNVVSIKGYKAHTSTGIEVNLDWQRLTLSQTGQDTKIINLLYKVHYLQWSPFKGFNQLLGIVGLLLLITLTVFGIKIFVKSRQ